MIVLAQLARVAELIFVTRLQLVIDGETDILETEPAPSFCDELPLLVCFCIRQRHHRAFDRLTAVIDHFAGHGAGCRWFFFVLDQGPVIVQEHIFAVRVRIGVARLGICGNGGRGRQEKSQKYELAHRQNPREVSCMLARKPPLRYHPVMSFHGAKVLAFESRRAKEIAELIRINGGEPFVAPAVIEAPIEDNREAFDFADRLYAGAFDMLIFLTGVGAKYLHRVLASRDPEERFPEALRQLTVVARGPKPIAVLREWNVPVTVAVPEPNTWRELLASIEGRPERSVALQEYGRTNRELIEGLIGQGRQVHRVPVYQWQLPADTAPLSQALEGMLTGRFDVALFTTGVQIEHFLEFADQHRQRAAALEGLRRMFIASIGPTCSGSLREFGLVPTLEPSHPKMGILVREAAIRFGDERASLAI